jgi:hypothetical protein
MVVFPAASKPSINKRISFDPNTFPSIFESWPPIVAVCGRVGFGSDAGAEWKLSVLLNSFFIPRVSDNRRSDLQGVFNVWLQLQFVRLNPCF